MSKVGKIIIYCVFCVIFVLGFLYYFNMPDGNIITITSNGKMIEKVDLSAVSESYELEVEHDGFNKILISHDKVEVIEADCPDKLCIHQSRSGTYPIVCLPHKLVIDLEKQR